MSKRDKNVAGILALFLGWLGIHRYYLGQRERGLFYTIGTGIMMMGVRLPFIGWMMKIFWVPFVMLVSVVDAISLFAMDTKEFDEKYNNVPREAKNATEVDRPQQREERPAETLRKNNQHQSSPPTKTQTGRAEPFKKNGLEKFADFDYEGAIAEFKQALDTAPYDVASHFNIACAYSLTEKADLALHHLDRAVAFGFKDFEKIKTHHALAFVRIQPAYEGFAANGFRLPTKPVGSTITAQPADLLHSQPDLLDQLKKLGDLRQKGLLTEQEFEQQKKRLLA